MGPGNHRWLRFGSDHLLCIVLCFILASVRVLSQDLRFVHTIQKPTNNLFNSFTSLSSITARYAPSHPQVRDHRFRPTCRSHRSAGFVRTDGYKMMIDDRGSKRPPCTGYLSYQTQIPPLEISNIDNSSNINYIYISAEIYASQFRNHYGVDLSELATRRGGTIEMRSRASKICF